MPPRQEPPSAAEDEALAALAESFGLSPEDLRAGMAAAAQGAGGDPLIPVFTGYRQRPGMGEDPTEYWLYEGATPGRQNRPGQRPYDINVTPGRVRRPSFIGDVPTDAVEDTTSTTTELLTEFYKWDRDELMENQRLLYAAGFYGDVDIAKVPWGVHDEASFQAWGQAVNRAASFYAAGRKLTVEQVLRTAARERLGADPNGAGGQGGAGAVVSLSDPVGLGQLLDSTANSVLGRKATPAEQRMFVGIVHRLQRESQLAAQQSATPATVDTDRSGDLSAAEVDSALAARGSGGATEVVQPSPEAQAAELLRQQNPAEAGAHDVADQFANFVGLLRGVV